MIEEVEKLQTISDQGIPYVKSKLYSLDLLYKIACIKELISSRAIGKIDCFGTIDLEDKACKGCLVKVDCKLLKEYQYLIKHADDLVAVSNRMGELHDMTPESVDDILEKVNFRKESMSFKIAKILLEHNNKKFSELLLKILEVCPEKDIMYARTRYYQIKRKLEDNTDLKIVTITEKIIHITRKG